MAVMAFSHSVLDLIGNTPLVQTRQLDTGDCELFLKLELANPGGSIKDRTALYMIEAAEESGHITPGDVLIEATAGNTGIGLALVAAQKGYSLKLVIPDKMSSEKIQCLRAMGAEVILTRSDVEKGHQQYYQDMALHLANESGAFYINQFENQANVKAHYETTGPEIWEQMEGRIDAFVCGVGTGGTLNGVGGFLREMNPSLDLVLADPEGSVLAPLVHTGRMPNQIGTWHVEGIGEDFVPRFCNLSLIDEAFSIKDKDAFETTRMLLRKESILAGSSSGTLLAAALKYCHEQRTPKRVVTLACDTGNRYLSKVFNNEWIQQHL